ncbi:unnamed protein product [Closterium sp. Naga37s-1]|nr:unnamed protein product [Closterium sp. Naga37s-1]
MLTALMLATHMLAAHMLAAHMLAAHMLAAHMLTAHTLAAHMLAAHMLAAHMLAAHTLAAHMLAAHTLAAHMLAAHTLAAHTLATPHTLARGHSLCASSLPAPLSCAPHSLLRPACCPVPVPRLSACNAARATRCRVPSFSLHFPICFHPLSTSSPPFSVCPSSVRVAGLAGGTAYVFCEGGKMAGKDGRLMDCRVCKGAGEGRMGAGEGAWGQVRAHGGRALIVGARRQHRTTPSVFGAELTPTLSAQWCAGSRTPARRESRSRCRQSATTSSHVTWESRPHSAVPWDGCAAHCAAPIDLDGEIDDVGILIDRLGLGPSAMPAADFVAIDNGQPTCAEPGEDPLADEPASAYSAASWEAPTSMEAVYNDDNPASREARRYARAACEMLIGYARATSITPRELCALFEIRNPIIIERMERASPPLNLNATPIATPRPSETPDAVRARPRGRVLPAWMTAPSPRQALIDAGAPAAMDGFMDAAEWVRL